MSALATFKGKIGLPNSLPRPLANNRSASFSREMADIRMVVVVGIKVTSSSARPLADRSARSNLGMAWMLRSSDYSPRFHDDFTDKPNHSDLKAATSSTQKSQPLLLPQVRSPIPPLLSKITPSFCIGLGHGRERDWPPVGLAFSIGGPHVCN